MSKNTVLRIFGEAFLRAIVIILGVAIIAFGGFFLYKVITGGSGTDDTTEATLSDEELRQQYEQSLATEEGDSAATTEEATEATTEEATVEEISGKGYKILVLNSTNTKGLARSWADTYKADGFATVDTGNYSGGALTNSKVIVSTEGMGNDVAGYLSGATVEVGSAPSGVDVSTDGYDIFVIIGTADNK